MKKIDVEAHFLTDDYVKYMHARKEFPKLEAIEDEGHRKFEGLWFEPDYCHAFTLEVINRLLDLGEGRLKEMDAAGIDMQVLSLSDPGCELFKATEATAITRKINNELSRVTKRHPDRFIGLATLAPQNPSAAADELNRAVTELGFRGGKINSNDQGEYLDDQKYLGIFEIAEKIGLHIYLNPLIP